MNKMAFVRPAALRKIERILDLLRKPMTVHDLAEAIPLSKRNTLEYLNHLKAGGQIHVAKWVRDIQQSGRMYPRPAYLVGDKPDAERPGPLTEAQRKVRAWERIKADPERHYEHSLRKRRYRADRRGPRRDIAANWITFAEVA